jgi:hypothetical protein
MRAGIRPQGEGVVSLNHGDMALGYSLSRINGVDVFSASQDHGTTVADRGDRLTSFFDTRPSSSLYSSSSFPQSPRSSGSSAQLAVRDFESDGVFVVAPDSGSTSGSALTGSKIR